MRARAGFIAASVGVAVAGGFTPPTTGTVPTLSLHRVGRFHHPVGVEIAPGAKHLLFVVEKTGRIIVLRHHHELSKPFLDIKSLVLATGGEQGLLSLAFDPGYDHN